MQVAFALREALIELRDQGGWQGRRSVYRARADRVDGALEAMGVPLLLAAGDYSSMLRSYRFPEGLSYDRLHDPLKAAGFVIYAGQGALEVGVFRLAFMGDLRESDLDQLIELLQRAIGVRA